MEPMVSPERLAGWDRMGLWVPPILAPLLLVPEREGAPRGFVTTPPAKFWPLQGRFNQT